MSKEELLRAIITEIDLIMHGKDYRFENKDGTWYSRESCKDLTNEELFEELKKELRLLEKLEDRLVEEERLHHECKNDINQLYKNLNNTIITELKKVQKELSKNFYDVGLDTYCTRVRPVESYIVQRIRDLNKKGESK